MIPVSDPAAFEAPNFDSFLESRGLDRLVRRAVTTLQVNVGKLCNQACLHCHVEAGPKRTEIMTEATVDRLLGLIEKSPSIAHVDITGGAPEMNPSFKRLVSGVRGHGREVTVRSNLTILSEPGYEDMVEFFVVQRVKVVASLPCYTKDNVDQQRGSGAFSGSINGLLKLNAAGFGQSGSGLILDLVYNPLGAVIPPAQAALEQDYKKRLREDFGIEFSQLYTITNMPIKRFAESLDRLGQTSSYMKLIVDNFNDQAAPMVMCRDLVSVSYDGKLYDCDFNQMLEIPLATDPSAAGASDERTLWSIDSFEPLAGSEIATDSHCFGCTAGSGSSCGGALT